MKFICDHEQQILDKGMYIIQTTREKNLRKNTENSKKKRKGKWGRDQRKKYCV